MKNLIAQIDVGGLHGVGTLGTPGTGAGTLFNKALSTVIGVMTAVAFIWFTFQIILGAIGIITSGGDKNGLESARKRITIGIVGLIVVVAAMFIVDLIGYLLGIPNILNPTSALGL